MSPQDYLIKGHRALASARLLLADGDTEGAVNRAYYAMFDAARAALVALAPGSTPDSIKTHRGLIGAFGQYLVKPQRVDVDLGRTLNQVERIRLLADYTGEVIDSARAGWAIEQASGFVDRIAELLVGRSDTPDSGAKPQSDPHGRGDP